MPQVSTSNFTILQWLICLIFISGCATKKIRINQNATVSGDLIYENDFDNLGDWKVEQMPGGKAEIIDGKLEITDVSGCTIWLTEKMEGPIMIEYDVVVIGQGGPQDRVSDLNCFWMANDPKNPDNLFADSKKRGGKFSKYDNLQLYYMGVGGHHNTKTRFRRYVGNGDRPLLPAHDLSDPKFLLAPNTPYTIRIIANGPTIQYYRNDLLMVTFQDAHPYTSGYFGFRTVNNHMTVDNFKVYKLN